MDCFICKSTAENNDFCKKCFNKTLTLLLNFGNIISYCPSCKFNIISFNEFIKYFEEIRISPKDKKLAISGLNLVKRHMRPKQSGQKGQIVSVERLVSASAVALVNKETGKFVRVGWQHDASGGKIRIDRKTKLPL